MSDSSNQYRSSALIPGVEIYPSEWSLLNTTLLSLPKDLRIFRELRMRPLAPRHREGLLLLHKRLFPINYDSRFYDTACRIVSDDSASSSDFWSVSTLIGIGMFLPKSTIVSNCDTRSIICCATPDSSGSTSESSASCSEHTTRKETANINTRLVTPLGTESNEEGDNVDDLVDTDMFAPVDCILNDATYDRENDEFLVGFLTLWVNQQELSPMTSNNDYFALNNFYEDIVFPYLQSPASSGVSIPTLPNFDHLSGDSYRFLFSNLYTNRELLDYLSSFSLDTCKTVYLLSAGVTMGLRSRFLGTHLIMFLQSMLYFCCYNVFIYNGDMFRCSDDLREPLLSTLNLHLNTSMDENSSLELDEISESEVAPFRLSISSVLDAFSQCERMPLSIYLHVISYNKKACEMYRRANFICVTRIPDFYTIDGLQYAANLFAFYMCPPFLV
ncbi:putative integral membrane protein [Babesia bovis T2Bo]|uniref:histone acetyltransferase n=1 Tax=Babesia bovis TaxID=5865 RepID=A7AQA8_BABBO|nr:putative integral membrane protein [Babesia bovis T2Bo]EDO08742.1 putative integral membrane protein [Babesia bovis T2Bo]|eukprot:XP_001612310.1 hypothetical protein [Babesia bovis T2Bo]